MRAERYLRVRRRDQAALSLHSLSGGVLGVHVVDFTWFLPNGETSRQRSFGIITRHRGLVVSSSCVRDIATGLGHHGSDTYV